jgi:hypothetical protein
MWRKNRVTRLACKNIAQNVAQPQLFIPLTVEKVTPKGGLHTYFCIFPNAAEKLNPMEENENLPDLVALRRKRTLFRFIFLLAANWLYLSKIYFQM